MAYFISIHLVCFYTMFCSTTLFGFTTDTNTETSQFQTNLIPVSNGNLWGFCDAESKKVVVIPQFRTVFPFSEGVAIVVKEIDGQSLFGVLDATGREIIRPQYEEGRMLKACIAVKKSSKWGIIKIDGTTLIPCEYDEIMDMTDNKIIVKRSGKVGLIDFQNKVIIPFNYEEMRPYKNGFAAVKRNRNWTFVNPKSKEISAPVYEAVFDFTDGGIAVVQQFGKRGILNTNGQEIVPCEYDRADNESEGLIGMNKGGKWGFLDKAGKIKIGFDYENKQYGSFVSGLAPISKDGKWGYISATNAIIVPLQFEMASNFSKNGSAKIQQKGKYSLINTKGTIITKQLYTNINAFSEGLAMVQRDGKCGFINEKGDEIIACEYVFAADFSNGVAAIFDTNKTVVGYIDNSGKAFFK